MASICCAILKCSLTSNQGPVKCTYKALSGTNFCGHHKHQHNRPPPPPPQTCAPEGTECSICMDFVKFDYTYTPCNHYFHTSCLNPWKNKSNSCPCCRSSLTTGKQKHKTKYERLAETINFYPMYSDLFNS